MNPDAAQLLYLLLAGLVVGAGVWRMGRGRNTQLVRNLLIVIAVVAAISLAVYYFDQHRPPAL